MVVVGKKKKKKKKTQEGNTAENPVSTASEYDEYSIFLNRPHYSSSSSSPTWRKEGKKVVKKKWKKPL